MIYISVQPDIAYFHWQVELYLFNFLQVGIKPEDVHVIFLYNGSTPSEKGLEMQKKNSLVNFFFYRDDRPDKSYIPSIKPYGMYKHFFNQKGLCRKQIFYHDSDIIFKEKIKEEIFSRNEENIQFMSDTISYIGYDYVKSKGEEQLRKMAEVVGISVDTIRKNQSSSGGAQYILSNVSSVYWWKVYEDSNKLYWLMDRESVKQKDLRKGDFPIQKWCAEMWATLWNLWYFRAQTKVHRELDFCSATTPISEWDKVKILHNAGVTELDREEMFFKGDYINKSPYEVDLSFVNPQYCSHKYSEKIKEFVETLQKN